MTTAADIAAWSGFQWIGLAVAGLALLCVVVAAPLVTAAYWQIYGPKFHCRAPETALVMSAYRRDVRTGEGERVKAADDLCVTFLLGISWRTRWVFGFIKFKRDSE